MNRNKVYLDFAATTPVDPRVVDVMLPLFVSNYGNPSSAHFWGQQGEAVVEDARVSIAESLMARPDEIVFTSGGTESDNLALRGSAFAERERRGANRILISPVEHHAIVNTAKQLERNFGFVVDFLPVDEFGRVDPADVAASLRDDTAVVSVIYANNEIGTINPIREIGEACREHHVPFHTDAVQAAAHVRMDVQRDMVDLLSIGAHKFYGPKGVGALYIRRGTQILAMNTGGSQEYGLRAGTQNVPYIAGMAEALKIAQAEINPEAKRTSALRDQLIGEVLKIISRAKLTGHALERLPNHASFVFEGVDGNDLLTRLDIAGFACSSGSACKVGTPEASEVLTAIGLPNNWALGSLRVTLGRSTDSDDIGHFLSVLPDVIMQARK